MSEEHKGEGEGSCSDRESPTPMPPIQNGLHLNSNNGREELQQELENDVAVAVQEKPTERVCNQPTDENGYTTEVASDSSNTTLADSTDVDIEYRPMLRRQARAESQPDTRLKRVSFKEDKDLVQVRSISPDAAVARHKSIQRGHSRLVTSLPIEHLKVTDFLESIGARSYMGAGDTYAATSTYYRSPPVASLTPTLNLSRPSSQQRSSSTVAAISRFSSLRQGSTTSTISSGSSGSSYGIQLSCQRPFSAFQDGSSSSASFPHLPGCSRSSSSGYYGQQQRLSAQNSSALIAVRRLASSRDSRLAGGQGPGSIVSRFGRISSRSGP